MTLALAISSVAFAQESFDPRGFPQPPSRRAPTVGVESDLARAYADEDVHLSASYEGSYGDRWYGSLQTLSAGKRFGDHTIFVRYRPGAAQRFGFGSLVEVPSEDRTASLTTSIDYREPFAFGYTFSPFEGLRVGTTWRYYAEDVAVEEIAATVDTATFDVEIVEETQTFAPNVWRADVGVSYQAREDLRASLGYANLIVAAEGDAGVDPAHLLRFEPTGVFGVDYDPLPRLRVAGRVETTGSFYLGVATSFSLLGGELSLGAAAARDWRMTPFIAAAQPSIRFAGDVFAISVVGAYYFSDRTAFRSLSNFLDRGVYSVTHNEYSFHRVSVALEAALATRPERRARLAGVEPTGEIFPTLIDAYAPEPIARGAVVNVSDEPVVVRGETTIEALGGSPYLAESVVVAPGETVEVPFAVLVERESEAFGKSRIAEASFAILDENGDELDRVERPVLLADRNGWDGDVAKLGRFASAELPFAAEWGKRALREEWEALEGVDPALRPTETARVLFNRFVDRMQYVADPRASTERAQFPSETLELRGGDCDDLSVAFAAILEGVGVRTAFVDYRADATIRHVNLLFDTGLPPEKATLVSENDRNYYVRPAADGKETVWLPLETTALEDYDTARRVASERFRREAIRDLGLAKGNVRIIDVIN